MFRHKILRVFAVCCLLAAFGLGVTTAPNPARALGLGGGIGDLVKIFGIAWVVERFGPQIDRAINDALKQHDAQIEGYTKVVPIVRVGSSTAVGAAQVMGPRVQVDKVQAVAEVELRVIGSIRGRGLIPVSTRDVQTVKGVGGVGVSANIKFPI
ncbi:MAG: hypothetical protein ABFD96_11245 [Armatimonadia bacterium]